jgi:hypothetical protein
MSKAAISVKVAGGQHHDGDRITDTVTTQRCIGTMALSTVPQRWTPAARTDARKASAERALLLSLKPELILARLLAALRQFVLGSKAGPVSSNAPPNMRDDL